MVKKFSPKIWQMVTFLYPLDSTNPIFVFRQFLGLGHLQGPGVSLGRILGVPSIEPLLGGRGGGSSQGALSTRCVPFRLSTPPPPLKAR